LSGVRRVEPLAKHGEGVSRVWAWSVEVFLDHGLERLEGFVVDIELLVQAAAYLALRPIDLARGEHSLSNDAPGLVRILVVTQDFRSDHVSRDVEPVT
jgi:hypothetical protein